MQSLNKQNVDQAEIDGPLMTQRQMVKRGRFSIAVHINYEDTDAGGVVYYGNYLGYMERARNAFLRDRGYPLKQLSDDHNILFVVKQAHLEYHLPALLDDVLQVTLKIESLSGAVVVFKHQVLRIDECLVEADIKLATLNKRTFRPTRIPNNLRADLLG